MWRGIMVGCGDWGKRGGQGGRDEKEGRGWVGVAVSLFAICLFSESVYATGSTIPDINTAWVSHLVMCILACFCLPLLDLHALSAIHVTRPLLPTHLIPSSSSLYPPHYDLVHTRRGASTEILAIQITTLCKSRRCSVNQNSKGGCSLLMRSSCWIVELISYSDR